jgi:hypothetical protein
MIQASIPKPIETKAPVRAEVVSNSKAPKSKKEAEASSAEAKEFAKELDSASEGETKVEAKAEKKSDKKTEAKGEEKSESEAEVKAVKVSAEQALALPSTLVGAEGSAETTSPKVFDSATTKSVEQLTQPKTTEVATEAPVKLTDAEVLELAAAGGAAGLEEAKAEVKGEIAQAMLKTPQVSQKNGRSPAIEFAQAEIDPQLLNNEDFVAQKNLVAKKSLPNAYGMKIVPAQQQKLALENGLKQTEVVKDASAVDGSVNSQQFILNIQNEQKNSQQLNETQAAPKVFDMSNIKSSNTNEIISQITDYVVQAKAAKEPTVNMRVNHDELGMIDISVSKVAGSNMADAIAINIGAHTIDGKNFFQQNSKDLFSHMASAGINVADMKVETPTQTAKNEFDFGSQHGRSQQGSEKQFGSEQNQRRHDQERRQDLWKLLNKEAA